MSNLPHYQQQQQTVTFAYSQGALQLTVLTPTIIRVFSNRGESGHSYAITGNKQQSTPFTLTTKDNHYELRTSALTVSLDADRHIDVQQ